MRKDRETIVKELERTVRDWESLSEEQREVLVRRKLAEAEGSFANSMMLKATKIFRDTFKGVKRIPKLDYGWIGSWFRAKSIGIRTENTFKAVTKNEEVELWMRERFGQNVAEAYVGDGKFYYVLLTETGDYIAYRGEGRRWDYTLEVVEKGNVEIDC